MAKQVFGDIEVTTYETPQIDRVNYADPRDVVAALNEINVNANEHRRETAEKYFEIGCLVGKGQTKISYREYGRMLGIPYRTVCTFKQVAEALHYDKELFNQKMDEINPKTWTTLSRITLPIQIRPNHRNSVKRLKQLIGEVLRKHDADEETQRDRAEIISLRNLISRYYPVDVSLRNQTYIKYYECCCCGSRIVPAGGFALQHYIENFVKYPICAECQDEGRKPEVDRIVKLYATYAINLEDSLYKMSEQKDAGQGR